MTDPTDRPLRAPADFAIVLSGGGARGAYQAGVLRGLGRHLPDLRFPIIAGVSAGGINSVFLAAHPGPLGSAAPDLAEIWRRLTAADIFKVDAQSLAGQFTRWMARLASGGSPHAPEVRGLVDTQPLHALIENAVATVDGEIVGIDQNLAGGLLHAVALTTINYSTGQTVTWVQGRDIRSWHRPRRPCFHTRLTVAHVMASAALPLFFPAVRLGDSWHGDGGVRLDAPLSAALHLGAKRILAISPRYEMTEEEAGSQKICGYPAPAQILSHLMNAIFLDVIDRDARQLAMMNKLLTRLPPEDRQGLRPVDIVVVRPSQDLGGLAGDYEHRLPRALRHLTRSLGTPETSTSDLISFVMFQPDYMEQLMEIGERDVEARIDEIRALAGGAGEAGGEAGEPAPPAIAG
ncbi:MAG: patatin-like phospholipase family protein [Acidobacteriota bacterium]|nr:patatin-like phospholipase family protein [Acidobacteriota bacterium]